ncbi:dihydrodipicolinate synthase family protein [Bryobacter aggregatus]|uniref:dihydrodipicolinate synthase family protein n=1 Tax=Bryobacter aggregatus TaxID=360054 RepID=UPI0004E24FAC|nr:dihydrodipicolinate synthase family protein [Bryobacter aggregatus]
MSQLREKLRGVFGFPVTPFNRDLTLDLDSLEKNVDAMTHHPYCAIVAAGGTGEIYSMTPDESVQVVEVAVKATQSRMPVVAGVGYNAAIGADMARRMEKAGADALLVMPPYYINAPEHGWIDYYKAIANATGLPLSLYSRDWAAFTPDQVARLADAVPTLQIWKDGQGNIRMYQRIMAKLGDRLAWVGGLGDDCAGGYWSIGVQAFTSSISNISPAIALAIAEAGQTQNFTRLNQIMFEYVHPLYSLRDKLRGYEVSVMKELMELLDIPAGPARPPLCAVREDHKAELLKLANLFRHAKP